MSKLAVCFFGQVKNFNYQIYLNYKNNVENILNQRGLLDYYLITYNNTKIYNPRNNEDCEIDYTSIFQYINFKKSIILDINSPKINNIDIFSRNLARKYGCSWQSVDFISTIFAIRQIYSLHRLFQNINTEYDKYVFLRPDLLFESELLDKFFDDTYDACFPMFDSYGGYNDRFCVLNYAAANIYCNRFNELRKKTIKYHSENFLKQVFDISKLRVKQIKDFTFKRVRCNGDQR